MKIFINLFYLTLTLFVFGSCTITKRHFGGGYHVEWKKKWNKGDQLPASEQDPEAGDLYSRTSFVSGEAADTANSYEKTMEAVPVSEFSLNSESPLILENEPVSQNGLISENENVKKKPAQVSLTSEIKPEAKKTVEPLTWVALGFLIAGIGVGLLPASLFSSLTLIMIVFALLFFIAFINAVSSAIRIKRNPDRYKAKGLTWLVLFFSSLGLALGLVLLILNAFFPV